MTASIRPRRPQFEDEPIPSESGDARTADEPMTAEQATELKVLAHQTYEPEAFSPQLTRAEATRRIATLSAKLKLLDEPPHTL